MDNRRAMLSAGASGPEVEPLTVLLFSPLSTRDPLSGDTSYTEDLLANPPPAVTFVDYSTAIEAGTMIVRGRFSNRHLWTRVDVVVFAVRLIEVTLRRVGLMFREPTWFVTIDAAAFDLVHLHLFAIRQIGTAVPCVSSAGLPLAELYAARERWPKWRTRVATLLEYSFASAVNAHVPWLRGTSGSIMTVYSDHFMEKLRSTTSATVLRIGTALPENPTPARQGPTQNGPRLCWIGRDFHRKGGQVALQAFELIRKSHPSARLTIATKDPVPWLAQVDGVTEELDAARSTITDVLLPASDVLIAPTTLDCGVPYAVLEALRAGVAVVISELPWLDDRLQGPPIRRVHGGAAAVAVAALDLLAVRTDERRRAAVELWQREFSMPRLQRDLRRAYEQVLSSTE